MTDAAEARPDEDRNQDADEVAALQTAPGRDWTGALDEAARRLVATKGWKGPEDVVSSYGHLEKLIGQKGVIRPGDNAPPEAWDSYYRALGRPDALVERLEAQRREELQQSAVGDEHVQ